MFYRSLIGFCSVITLSILPTVVCAQADPYAALISPYIKIPAYTTKNHPKPQVSDQGMGVVEVVRPEEKPSTATVVEQPKVASSSTRPTVVYPVINSRQAAIPIQSPIPPEMTPEPQTMVSVPMMPSVPDVAQLQKPQVEAKIDSLKHTKRGYRNNSTPQSPQNVSSSSSSTDISSPVDVVSPSSFSRHQVNSRSAASSLISSRPELSSAPLNPESPNPTPPAPVVSQLNELIPTDLIQQLRSQEAAMGITPKHGVIERMVPRLAKKTTYPMQAILEKPPVLIDLAKSRVDPTSKEYKVPAELSNGMNQRLLSSINFNPDTELVQGQMEVKYALKTSPLLSKLPNSSTNK